MGTLTLIAGLGNAAACLLCGAIFVNSWIVYRDERKKNAKLATSYKEATERLMAAVLKQELAALENKENTGSPSGEGKVIFS